jgi:hypothetical protein
MLEQPSWKTVKQGMSRAQENIRGRNTGLAGTLATSQAQSQSASSSDYEIVVLKQQLKMLEQKIDKLQARSRGYRGDGEGQDRSEGRSSQGRGALGGKGRPG